MTRLHRSALAFLLAFALTLPVLAQPRTQAGTRPRTAPPAGETAAGETVTPDDDAPPADAWALLFGVGQNFTLAPFSGATLSAKYQQTPARAWRLGLTLEASDTDREGRGSTRFTRSGLADTTVTEDRLEGESSGGLGTLSVERVVYLRRRDAFHLYAAAGPFGRYGRQRFDNDILRIAPTTPPVRSETRDEQRRTDTEWAGGAVGALGAEWFVRGGLSVTAEYGASLGYTRGVTRFSARSTNLFSDGSTVQTQETLSRDRQTFGGWSLNAAGVRLGLAVYF